MRSTALLVWLVIVPSAVCQSPSCHGKPLDSESTAMQILSTSTPSESTSDKKECITGAIEYASEVRDSAAIHQLIRYLSFSKGGLPQGQATFLLHPSIEGDEYPAVLALARIGASARITLLQVIESSAASSLEQKNATHAIVLSFLEEPEHDPGKGILYLRKAKGAANPGTQKRFDEMINYALTTQACIRFAPKCEDAMKQAISQKTD